MLCPTPLQPARCLECPAAPAAVFQQAPHFSASERLARVLCGTLASTVSIASKVAVKARGDWRNPVKPAVAGGSRHQPRDQRAQIRQHRAPLQILFEDDALLVVDKPAGVLSQAATPGGDSLCSQARRHLAGPRKPGPGAGKLFVGLIHRLDRDVTGVCAMAKTREAAKWMSKQFSGRLARKEYLAVVRSWSQSGSTRLEHRYMVDESGQASEASDSDSGARDCSLICHPIASGPSGVTVLLVRLLTGRRHQIRYQLAAEGSPLLGDTRYGSGPRDGSRRWIRRPALHAWSLSFQHPDPPHADCQVAAPIPGDMHSLMSAVGISLDDTATASARAAIGDTVGR